MTAAGLIYALDNSHAAAPARDLGETLIDASTVATDGSPQAATITFRKTASLSFDCRGSHSQLALVTFGHDGAHEKETRAK